MAKRSRLAADVVLDAPDPTMLDVIDTMLNRGVMADGDLMLGVAGVDLIYLRLAALLCTADQLLPLSRDERERRLRRRRRGARMPT